MGTYNAKQRKKYATVGKDEFPIGDKVHAEKALQFINSSDLTSSEKTKVRAKADKMLGKPAKPAKTTKKGGKP